MASLTKHSDTENRPAPGRWLFDLPALSSLFEEPMPRIEEVRDDGHVVVRFEMPGIDPDKDVEITVADGTLRIEAERRQESKDEEHKTYRSEFQYGSYTRAIDLPAGATDEDVEATYKDGILEVRVPVNEQRAEARKVPVTRR